MQFSDLQVLQAKEKNAFLGFSLPKAFFCNSFEVLPLSNWVI